MKVYQGAIDYAHHSAYLFTDPNLDKVSKLMVEGLAYYKGIGEPIRNATIEAFCDKCWNTGERKIIKRRGISKIVPCECGKVFTSEKIEVSY